MRAEEIAKTIDHTLLRAEATSADVEALCREAAQYHFAAVCLFPHYVPMASSLLRGTDVKTCTVISFPYGADRARVKALAADERCGTGPTRSMWSSMCPHCSPASSGWCGTSSRASAGRACARRRRGRGQVIVKAIIEDSLTWMTGTSGLPAASASRPVWTSSRRPPALGRMRDCERCGAAERLPGRVHRGQGLGGICSAADAERTMGAGAVRLGTSSSPSSWRSCAPEGAQATPWTTTPFSRWCATTPTAVPAWYRTSGPARGRRLLT